MKLGRHFTYIVGYVASMMLTLAAYGAVTGQWLMGRWLIGGLVVLALVQLVVQLKLFLHLGDEAKPRWQLMAFWFMLLVLIILVAGSLWIMYSLNYRMTPEQMNQYLIKDEGIHL